MIWYLLVLISALFLSGQDLLKKKLLIKEHTNLFTTIRVCVIAALGFVLIPFLDFSISLEILFLMYVVSIGCCIGMLYLARAVKHLEITVTAPMTNITPAFILLFAFIFLKETPTLAQIGGIMLLIAGAYLLEIRPHKHSTFQPIVEMIRSKYMHYLLGAIIAFALLAVFEKHFVTNLVQPLTYIFFFWIFISMNFVFLHWYRYGLSEVRQEIGKGLKWYVIGGIFSVLASITYLIALSHTPVTLVIPLRRSTTLFTTLIGGRMFKESNNHMKIAACIIMILGVYLIIGT